MMSSQSCQLSVILAHALIDVLNMTLTNCQTIYSLILVMDFIRRNNEGIVAPILIFFWLLKFILKLRFLTPMSIS